MADDDEGVRSLFCKVLDDQGYPVTAVAGGGRVTALLAVQQEDIRLVIIDLAMPEHDGIEAICSLRKSRSEVKILAASGAFTGRMLDSMLTCASMLGADATLPKPVRPEDLLAMVRTLIG